METSANDSRSADATRQGCLFCEIVAGLLPCHRLFEDESTLAFLDVRPNTDGHTLVIPTRHVDDLFAATADEAAAVMRTARIIALRAVNRLGVEGVTLIQANGKAGWQGIPHLHMHVIPRWSGDGLVQPDVPATADGAKLADLAERLR